APTCTPSRLTSKRAARASRRRPAVASGYLLTSIRSRSRSTTPGSGSNGFSLLDSLKASAPACLPCRYGGRAAISGRTRTGMSSVTLPSLGARSALRPPLPVGVRDGEASHPHLLSHGMSCLSSHRAAPPVDLPL